MLSNIVSFCNGRWFADETTAFRLQGEGLVDGLELPFDGQGRGRNRFGHILPQAFEKLKILL